jgi:Fe-S-cluster containining protein
MDGEPTYDCQQCGACCISIFGSFHGYAALLPAEAETIRRLGLPVLERTSRVTRRTTLHLGTAVIDRPTGEQERVCVAFTGTIGGSCGCSIYTDRPISCRALEPGSFSCQCARQVAGLPPGPEPKDN